MMKRIEIFQTTCGQNVNRVDPIDQIIVRPMAKTAGVAAEFVRFLCPQKGSSCLVDWDRCHQREFRRVSNLPVIHRLWVHRTGYSLGCTKRGRQDPTQLFFLSTEGAVLSVVELEQSITNIVDGENRWFVGSKTGALHAFSVSGQTLWKWHAPEFVDPYHPVPLCVSCAGNQIVAGTADVLYALSFAGTVVWRAELPDRAEARYRIEVPDAGTGSARDQALHELGISGTGFAGSAEILRLRQTFSTERPGWFGPERPLSLMSQEEEQVVKEEIVLEMHLGGSMCSEDLVHIRASGDGVLVGTSAGRVCFFDRDGRFMSGCAVGNGPACTSVGFGVAGDAVHCGGVLTLFDRRRPVGTVSLPDYYAQLVAQGRNVLVWAWDRAWLVSERGDLLWNGTFPRRIRSAFADELGFSVLAGPLHRFRVRKRGSGARIT